MRRALPLLSLLPALLLLPALAAALDVPYLTGRVNDYANMLSPEQKQRIEQKLAGFEQRGGGAQVVVLTVPSLEGDAIEAFSVRAAQTWKLGREEKDNGVLLVIAQQDRKMRVEVGYGLEPVLTDLESGIVLDEVIRPRFQAGDFGGGIEAGVDAILQALAGELTPQRPATRLPTGGFTGGESAIMLLIFGLVVGVFSLVAIASPGCQGWFLYLFLTPFYFIFPAMVWPMAGPILGIGWLVAFPILKTLASRLGFGRRWLPTGPAMGRRHRRGGGGWIIGGGGFGGFGGGGFGGGGG
ncbi:MAG TPA: TPM domain-containing protein, partial [Thermoanaerobaculia bacterium]|nr:TPM domain-containing protein [Thermoanaerobaculia bacterium]